MNIRNISYQRKIFSKNKNVLNLMLLEFQNFNDVNQISNIKMKKIKTVFSNIWTVII